MPRSPVRRGDSPGSNRTGCVRAQPTTQAQHRCSGTVTQKIRAYVAVQGLLSNDVDKNASIGRVFKQLKFFEAVEVVQPRGVLWISLLRKPAACKLIDILASNRVVVNSPGRYMRLVQTAACDLAKYFKICQRRPAQRMLCIDPPAHLA